jgi:type I restriction-modification system DNA methylase subunit
MGLFNKKLIERTVTAQPPTIPERHRAALVTWANSVRNGDIEAVNESQGEQRFNSLFIENILGYVPPVAGQPATMKPKERIGNLEVDLALGEFPVSGPSRIIAPFELKGAVTRDLDAPMPGRKITPVQQAWDYANANAGTRWVLVSNFREIRLYAFGEGNQFYEKFDLSKIDDPAEYARLTLLLNADNFLGHRTSELLKQSKEADKEISTRLYSEYKTLREMLIHGVSAEGLDSVSAVGAAQKILDRVLFAAFAEDQGLLPRNTLNETYKAKNPYKPLPVWENFKGLFRAIDEGSAALNISRYNGGLFKHDPLIDDLHLPDSVCEQFAKLGEYDFASEVSVTVLGRIFEQSVSDIEKLLARARGEAEEEKTSGVSGRRKRDGIVYTPDYIAHFIVEKTLGTHVEELFRKTMAEFAKGQTEDYFTFAKGRELAAWESYRLKLSLLRVVDPACGSGVFLVTAFDWLKAEYERANKKIADLKGKDGYYGDLLDIDREILSQNLYGVDVNAESVEISKLSLWLKTARRGKELDSLDHNIVVGDSLIEDSNYAYLKHGFSWHSAFPEVFAEGGFDVVLGNPPYVRMELIKPMKPYLETRFEVVSDRADLYCYFFERGLRLLKPEGRLGYISSSTFFKTGSGAPLRRYLLKEAAIDTVTDFGDLQIFEGVTTYPAILTMQKRRAADDHQIQFWKLNALPEGNFSTAFGDSAQGFPQGKLSDASWELEADGLRALREKITRGKKTLKEVYGSPLYGIKTGLNEAFVIDRATRDRLVADDPKSAEILKPFLEGKDLKRWRAEPRDLWIIYIPKNAIRIDDYPAIKKHLLPFKDALEKRATKQEWFELQQAQAAYLSGFEQVKISYPHFSVRALFHLEETRSLSNDKSYFVPSDDLSLLALLNSDLAWYLTTALAPPVRGGYFELRVQYIETLPIPNMTDSERSELRFCAMAAQSAAKFCLASESALTRRIPDLCPPDRSPKLTEKLKNWWELADFAAFRAEVKKTFKADIPLKERSEWEDLFTSGKTEITRLSAEIARHEAQINAIVYKLFDLTPDEITLLEESLQR